MNQWDPLRRRVTSLTLRRGGALVTTGMDGPPAAINGETPERIPVFCILPDQGAREPDMSLVGKEAELLQAVCEFRSYERDL
jgi:hypothetical protein